MSILEHFVSCSLKWGPIFFKIMNGGRHIPHIVMPLPQTFWYSGKVTLPLQEWNIPMYFNPPTTRVKISQNFDILPKVCLLHLKVKHCQTLRVVRTFTGQNYRFWLVKALSGIVQGGQNDSKKQSKMPPVCTFWSTVKKKKAVDWFWPLR